MGAHRVAAAALVAALASLALHLPACSCAPPAWSTAHEQTDEEPWGNARSPSVRYSHTAVVYGGNMITTHGYFYDKSSGRPAWQYDTWSFSPGVRRWTLLYPKHDRHVHGKDHPHARYGHTAVLYKSGLWVFGGTDGGARINGNQGYIPGYDFSDLWRFDLDAHTWEEIKPASKDLPWPEKRHLHVAVALGDRMYVHGGIGAADTWRFSFETREWEELKNLSPNPGVRYGHAVAAAPGGAGFYLYAGRQFTGNDSGIYDDLWYFHGQVGRWLRVEQKGTKPAGRLYHSMAFAPGSGELVVTGGSTSSPAVVCSREVWTYGIEDKFWLKSTALPAENYHHTTVVVGNSTVYSFGGHKCGVVSRLKASYYNSVIACDLGDRDTREVPLDHEDL